MQAQFDCCSGGVLSLKEVGEGEGLLVGGGDGTLLTFSGYGKVSATLAGDIESGSIIYFSFLVCRRCLFSQLSSGAAVLLCFAGEGVCE